MRGACIEFLEDFVREQEDVNEHRNLNDAAQGKERLITNAVVRHSADDLQCQDNQGGTRSECRGKKTRPDNRRIPEGSSAQANVQERGDRVNGDGPDNGDKHERDVEPSRRPFPNVPTVKKVTADVQVQQQITVEHDYVPTEH